MKLILTFVLCVHSFFCIGLPSAGDLTVEEKVGQVLMVHFHGDTANDAAQQLIQTTHIGGVIYYNWANDLSSPKKVRELSNGLQKIALENPPRIPLIVAVDQEGGDITRLKKGFTIFPENKILGMTGDPVLVEQSAFAMGEEMRAVGVNMNLAPVIDINNNPRNPMIGFRSFSDQPKVVFLYAQAALRGYQQADIISSIKHYPGHGDVEVDSHQDLPFVNKSLQELEECELVPFSLLADKADTVMTGHIFVPALDPKNCATLSRKALDYLREKIGFAGVIITDSLVMQGVLKQCESVDEAAVQAFNAGCDILLLGGKVLVGSVDNFELTAEDIYRIHKTLVDAVKVGRISEERLNKSVQRILDLKSRHHLEVNVSREISPAEMQKHQELANKIFVESHKAEKPRDPLLKPTR